MKEILIAPSILSADFGHLLKEIKDVENGGASFLHFDVMDGHFVNNISFGQPVLKSIYDKHGLINDCHLMIEEPLKYIDDFIKDGADIITIHYETCNKDTLEKIIEKVHQSGKKIGISIKPNTNINLLDEYLKKIDLVLVMSVEPGFGGQKFIDSSLEKISYLKKFKEDNNLSFLIEVDGGINQDTARKCIEQGADVLVAGSYIFKAKNRKEAIDSLKV